MTHWKDKTIERIAVDFPWDSSAHMGTGTYCETAVRAMSVAAPNLEIVLLVLPQMPRHINLPNVKYFQCDAGKWGNRQHRLHIANGVENLRADCLFAPATLLPAIKVSPMVTTVHDLTFIEHPEYYGNDLVTHLKLWFQPSLSLADRVIAISNETKCALLKSTPTEESRISVVRQPIRESILTNISADEEALAQQGIDAPFLFHISNLSPHKNVSFVVEVFALYLRHNPFFPHLLVIAGGGIAPNRPIDFREAAARLGVLERLRFLGRVDDSLLTSLYRKCDAFLFPSLAEGWGLPAAEAAACGAAVFASEHVPAAMENPSARVIPLDAADWVAALNEPRRKGLWRSPTFEDSGRQLIEVVQMAVNIRKSQSDIKQRVIGAKFTDKKSNVLCSPKVFLNRSVQLSGCMILKNGIRLGYPFVEAVLAVIDFVYEMVIVDGGSDDETWSVLSEMARTCPKIVLRCQPWPKVETSGRVIAMATIEAIKYCRGTHILYVQADEVHTEGNLNRLQELLNEGFNSAAFPFLHFRTGWWTVSANPAYVAAVRCIPNKEGIVSVGDGYSFDGPLAPCAPPQAFEEFVFHVGWVYGKNILEKHKNHALIYQDSPSYLEKARKSKQASHYDRSNLEAIDDAPLARFEGTHPPVIQHLINLPEYQYGEGMRLWKLRFSKSAAASIAASIPS